MAGTTAHAVHFRTGEVETDVAARLGLRSVGLHRGSPSRDDFLIGHVHQHRGAVGWLSLDRNGVKHQLLDSVRLEFDQFSDTTVARETGGVAYHAADDHVIRVLVFNDSGREYDAWAHAADDRGKRQHVGQSMLHMRIATELDKLKRSPEECGGFFRLNGALGRCTVRAGFTPRTDDKVSCVTGLRLAGDHSAAAKFDVVGMRAKGKEKGAVR